MILKQKVKLFVLPRRKLATIAQRMLAQFLKTVLRPLLLIFYIKKNATPAFAEYRTTNGYRVLCGKNNLQNEYITHKVAERSDFWFHVKNMPGSHVVMLLEGREEPPAEDFTEAASIAALFSAAEGAPMTEVDYTTVRNLKKAPGGAPGFVIYHTNWSAIVTPDKEKIASLRVK